MALALLGGTSLPSGGDKPSVKLGETKAEMEMSELR